MVLNGSEHATRRFAVIGTATGLTQIFSTNLAAAETLLPTLLQAARDLAIEPASLLVSATLAISCDFMLPVSTPTNAIVYTAGRLPVRDMLQAGIPLTFISMAVNFIIVTLLMP
jgi:sodium-dependent dicarboxylate transporter 2/3/5